MLVADLTLPREPADVWPHLRDPALIRRWFGWEYEGLDHEIDVIFLQEAAVDDASRTLEWGDGIQEGDRFALEDLGVETGLRITRGAPEDGYDEIAEGWITFAQQLRFALEHGGGRERRTLHLTGGPRGATDRAAALEGAEPWYRTEHQTGVLAGGCLLAVWENPAAGTSAMTLTSFGDPIDEARWRAWWAEP